MDENPVARQTADGGFVVAGSSLSDPSGNKVSPYFGQPGAERSPDYWILRLDSEGHKIWERSFGGSRRDMAVDACQLRDGGFIVAGMSRSGADGNKINPHYGAESADDIWILRLDPQGNRLWEKNLGGDSSDSYGAIIQTWDGGFMIAGTSQSSPGTGTKTSPLHGYFDYWIVRVDGSGIRVDGSGTELWQESYGGIYVDQVTSLAQTRDGPVSHSGGMPPSNKPVLLCLRKKTFRAQPG